MGGSISLDRRLLDWEWHDEPLMGWLWVNLLLMANHKDKKWHGIVIQRGQLVTTVAKLVEQTGLTERQVHTRLDRLKSDGSIIIKTSNKYTLITICKYDSYQIQSAENVKQASNESQSNVKQTSTNNKDNNIINNINIQKDEEEKNKVCIENNIDSRKQKFYDSLIPYLDKYGKEMLRSFFDYWSEYNRSGTKMRYELQPTWQVGMRLSTWSRHNNNKLISNGNKTTADKRRQHDITAKSSEDYEEDF